MAKQSAGLLFYRFHQKNFQVLLVHPGGPYWSKKEIGSWTIPKGELNEAEAPLLGALREVEEETGIKAEGNFIELTPVKQKSGKVVYAWATELDFDPAEIISNTFEIEWPPRSGTKKSFPEIDKAGWFGFGEAESLILEAQRPLLSKLKELLSL